VADWYDENDYSQSPEANPADMTVKRILTQRVDTQTLPDTYPDAPAAEAFV
jgi:hypothetical protein